MGGVDLAGGCQATPPAFLLISIMETSEIFLCVICRACIIVDT